MAVTNVSHIAIAVRDMDRALPSWTDVVGLHVTLDAIEEFLIHFDQRAARRDCPAA